MPVYDPGSSQLLIHSGLQIGSEFHARYFTLVRRKMFGVSGGLELICRSKYLIINSIFINVNLKLRCFLPILYFFAKAVDDIFI